MRIVGLIGGILVVGAAGVGVTERAARADEAVVVVGGPDRERGGPVIVDGEDEHARERAMCAARDEAPRGSAARVALGGAVASAGRGAAPGLDLGIELGRGPVGARLGAAWMRGTDPSGAGDAGGLSGGLAQYVAEVTVDAHPRGPWHPVAAIGVGLAHVSRGAQAAVAGAASGNAGIGTARVALAYALPVEDADVRVGVSILGALPGPAESEASDLRGYVMAVASLAVGF